MLASNASRDRAIDDFLQSCDLGQYQRKLLAADASFRRYERIQTSSSPYVLMDAPPPQEDITPFVKVTQWLQQAGLHAPAILHSDELHGFLLLEDFGDISYSSHLRSQPEDEWLLYQAAIDVLLHLRGCNANSAALPAYSHEEYMREVGIFAEWFLPSINSESGNSEAFLAIWQALLQKTTLQHHAVVLRDYHADNLMWLPEQTGLSRVGLLDYQDALLGDAAYDLMSLLEDARRDVSPDISQRAMQYYNEQSGEDTDNFTQRYCLLAAQRNCKIIGIFHRLHARDGKAHYLDYLPRVWAHLARDVSHPALEPLRVWLQHHLPEPYAQMFHN